MDSTLQNFEKRQKALRRKHKRMAQGYVNKLDRESGLIVQKPDSKSGGFAIRLLFLIVLAFMAFKIFLLAGLGEQKYLSHIQSLSTGSVVEQAGAWLMRIDPVTDRLAPILSPYLM
ncbi:hypothetical protein ACN2XU_01475 [Primorskyibacter sp. 2E107]|uniref:hypothetical protein n=1 Tax=Primorskyibacter sp. 2E107 TaxID=3403458 RepID=UPI003AF55ECE